MRKALQPFFLLLFLLAFPFTAEAQSLDSTKLAGIEARAVGPAAMSGRVTAIDVVESNPDIIYAGSASGGLWKSKSGGTDWGPIFDEQPVASIGAIAIYQKNPSVIYVGTGEGNPRNSETAGNGVYKTLDGGKTWQHLGLDMTRNIHRVAVHPENPDIVYAAAQGTSWGENEERGIYKSTDGGESWEKILYVDERTGAADLVMDPENPNKLFAAMWEYRRWPWFFESGGAGSGLYVTHDGGETWEERTSEDGLPEGEFGRLGLAVAPSDPDRVYALVESENNALYRSDDGGFSWQMINDDMDEIGGRPFYYHDLLVDTKNKNRLYSLHSIVTYSEDGGESFETLIPYSSIHPDHHAWWIHPEDPDFIIDGNDGGLAISRDRGETWRHVENLPLGQFYHINYDMERPYNIYGGMQDNGSWKGPAYAWQSGGLRNSYWQEVAFGDGFDVVPDPEDARYGYAMSQGGNLYRYDSETGARELIRPQPPEGDSLRFNWNAGIAQSPHDPATIYYGSQYVHRSTDCGQSWEIISPDLTTDDPEKQRQLDSGGLTYDVTQAENFTTILAIASSPLREDVIWVGTDDGNVQVTRNGGESWTNVVENIEGVPEGTWVPQVRASTYRPSEAFVVFDNHRRDDWTPYVYRTRDYGQSWERLVDEDDAWGYALSVVQDPVEPNLLFLGTEFGLYFSIDGGESWAQWTSGYPTVSTMDLQIHSREHDLIVGTFGRSAYILDDIRPLRALAREGAELLDEPLHAFEAPDAVLAEYNRPPGGRFTGDAAYAGENRPYGALLTYVVNPPEDAEDEAQGNEEAENDTTESSSKALEEVTIRIVDAEGDTIRTFKGPAEPGLNRTNWELRRKGVRFPTEEPPEEDTPEPAGASVLPGTYTAHISYGDHTDTTPIRVEQDPRLDIAESDLEAQRELQERLERRVELATEAVDRLREARETTRLVDKQLEDREDEAAREAREQGQAMRDSIQALAEIINPEEVQGIRRDPSIVSAKLSRAASYLSTEQSEPGPTDRRALERAERRLQDAIDAINAFFDEDWPSYRQAVEAANPQLFEDYEPLEMKP